jgi:hypothetical protein
MNCKKDIFRDESLECLGNYLFNGLNNKLPQEYKEQGYKIVNTLYYFDVPTLDISQYPILKIYRLNRSSKRYNPNYTSLVRISYGLAYPDFTKLGLLNTVAEWLDELLLEYSTTKVPMFRKLEYIEDRIEFSTMISSLNQQVFNFLSMLISVQE